MNSKAPWLLLSLAVASTAHAYDGITHSSVSEYAIEHSVLNDPTSGILASLCFGATVDDRRCLLRSSSPFTNTLTPLRLIREGAVREDDGTRSVNHFFDPQNDGQPLTYGVRLGDASPDWALEDRFDIGEQAASMTDAKRLFHAAVTGPIANERERALAQTFEALGHVVHHIQDMAQPQHVRNDAHCDRFFTTWFAPLPIPGACAVTLAFRPSGYEAYTRSRGREIPLAGYRVADYGTFEAARSFWLGSGMGVSEFTSNNFVSADKNFALTINGVAPHHEYPSPGSQTGLEKRQITDADLLGPQGPNQPLSGELWFVSNQVTDLYDASRSTTNRRASVYSVFDSDLRQKLDANPRAFATFRLNRFTYAAANELLLPRAAAYSAGLINYFFRGRIGIALPADGVYGIVDHGTINAAGQGFDKIKLRLSNASPDGVKPSGEKVPQTMEGGTLVAVAKYTLNSCYQPDLSGDFAVRIDTGEVINPANCSFDQYFAGEEQVSQSAALLAVTLDKTPTEFTFDFGSQPIPINARDLRVQVVYTGQVGAEADGIAFGGRDISEPTHLMVYNNSDWYLVDGKFYTPAEIRSSPTLSDRVRGLNIDPTALTGVTLSIVSGRPVTGPAGAVAVNGYVRVAVLADIDAPFNLRVKSTFQSGGTVDSTFQGIWANTTDLRAEQPYITPFGIYRGPRGHFVDVVFKANSGAPLLDNELVIMSGRQAGDPGPTPIPVLF